MTNQVIQDAAVEAAAEAVYGGTLDGSIQRDAWLADFRKALEAAAPHMLAEAWEQGMQAMYDTTSSEWPPIPEQNPYRSQA